MWMSVALCFFFSSRRRHTRFDCDWSSDVCSSDLNREAHRTSMLLAFAFSSVFLISYIVNHALHGDTIFPGHGPVRTLYLSILASHVILSIVALPMVLTTLFFSLTGRFAMHRRIARWTFPIWLYVSINGAVVFAFLQPHAY